MREGREVQPKGQGTRPIYYPFLFCILIFLHYFRDVCFIKIGIMKNYCLGFLFFISFNIFVLFEKAFCQINESDTLKFQMRQSATGTFQIGNFELFVLRYKLDLSTRITDKWVFKTQNSYLYQTVAKKRVDEDIYSRNFIYFKPQSLLYGFAIAFVSTNFRRKIEYRYFTGIGATLHLLRTKNHVLKFANALLYEDTRFRNNQFNDAFYDGNKHIKLYRSSHWLIGNHFLFNNRLHLYYYAFFQPSLNRFANYRAQIESILEIPIRKNLLANFTHIYTYENVIVKGLKNYDSILTYGITYQFKYQKKYD